MSDLPKTAVESAPAVASTTTEEKKTNQNENAPGNVQEQTAVTEAEIKPTAGTSALAEPDANTAEPATPANALSTDPAQLDPSLSALAEQNSKVEVTENTLQQSLTALDGLPEQATPNGSALPNDRSRSESMAAESVKSGGSSSSALPDNVPRVGGVRCCKSQSTSDSPSMPLIHFNVTCRLGISQTALPGSK
jgi:hypothetical protein